MSLTAISEDEKQEGRADDAPASAADSGTLSDLALRPGVKWLAAAGLGLAAIAALVAIATYAPGSMALTLGLFTAAFVALYAVWRGAFWPTAAMRNDLPWDAAFDLLPEALFITSRGGRLVYANEAYTNLLQGLGFKRGLSLSRILARDRALGPTLYRLEVSARRGTAVKEEVVVASPDGDFHRWRIEASPLAKPTRFIMWRISEVAGDITLEGHSGAKAAAADLVDGLPLPAFGLDVDGTITHANESARALLNPAHGDLVQGIRLDVLFEGCGQDDLGHDAPNTDVPVLLAAKASAHRNLSAQVSLWRTPKDEQGNSIVICLAPLAEAETADLPAALGQIMEAAPVAVALLTPEGRITRANKAFEDMARREGLDGTALLSLVDANSEEAVATMLRAQVPHVAGRALPQISFEAQPVDAEGERPAATAFMARVGADGGGEDDARLLMAFDVSEHKKLEAQFHQAQKMQTVGRLAGGIAHDFNNLLTAVIGFCDLLLVRHQVGDPSFADINQIRQNATRAANLTGQLLAFSRRQALVPKVLNLTDLLSDTSSLLRRLLGEKIELEFIHAREVGRIKADESQITQVLTNLVVNARDAIGETGGGEMSGGENASGKVTVRTKRVSPDEVARMGHDFMPAQSYELIEVSDTGCGIPDKIRNHIFEPFFTTKGTGEGTGLGLSTVYGIVKQTGGFIFVDSEVGRGTTFRIYLPTYEGDEKAASEQVVEDDATTDTTGQGVLLLVEDETAVRAFATRALTMRGYTVLEAEDGEDALRVLEDHDGDIDLVVSDVVMPGLDGPGLVEKLRAQNPELKVIFMSGYAEDSFRKQLEESGGEVHFLPKPFSLPQLAGMVKKVIGAEDDAA